MCAGQGPDDACTTCGSSECGSELNACIADTKGAGGAGGGGGGAACIGCGDVITGGDHNDTCPDSATIYDARLACTCGDGAQLAGHCD